MVQKQLGDFANVRAWHSYGAFDESAAASISTLQAAGFVDVGVYLFPCPTKDIGAQVQEMVANLTAAGVKYGSIWLDIESDPSTGCSWSQDLTKNCQTMAELAAAVNSTGIPWGTYTSAYEWGTLMNPGCTVPLAVEHPLWYPHYEKPPK